MPTGWRVIRPCALSSKFKRRYPRRCRFLKLGGLRVSGGRAFQVRDQAACQSDSPREDRVSAHTTSWSPSQRGPAILRRHQAPSDRQSRVARGRAYPRVGFMSPTRRDRRSGSSPSTISATRLIFDEHHLRRTLSSYVQYYHRRGRISRSTMIVDRTACTPPPARPHCRARQRPHRSVRNMAVTHQRGPGMLRGAAARRSAELLTRRRSLERVRGSSARPHAYRAAGSVGFFRSQSSAVQSQN